MIKYCECGCGEAVKEGKRYLSGHEEDIEKKCLFCNKIFMITSSLNHHKYCCRKCYREDKKSKKNKRNSNEFFFREKSKYCRCGCRELAPKHRFYIPGHRLQKRCRATEKWDEIKDIKKYCKCGCGKNIEIKLHHISHNIPDYIKGHRSTSIEIAIEEQLKLNNYKYEKQKYIKNVGIVDFFLLDYNIILECDGDYFHTLEGIQQRDSTKDLKATLYHNYRTIRFWEHEINESPKNCIKNLKKYIKI